MLLIGKPSISMAMASIANCECLSEGTPLAGWFNFMENPTEMDDDWGYPH